MTSFTLLAAGQSARMKTDKALLDFQGRPWIVRQVEEIRNSKVIDQLVIVDLPQKTDKYRSLISQKALSHFEIRFVENYLENSSPSDSILCSFQSQDFRDGSFVSPIDVPLDGLSIQKLFSEKRSGFWAVKPSYQGHGGHPVWLSSEAIGKFRQEPKRLDEFIAQLPPEKLQFIDVENAWTQLNLNTPTEWQEFLTDLQGPRAN